MPDLQAAPAVTDPFCDLLVAKTPDPGTNKQYIADPARIGPVTGSPLPDFIANNLDGSTARATTIPSGSKSGHPRPTMTARLSMSSKAKTTS